MKTPLTVPENYFYAAKFAATTDAIKFITDCAQAVRRRPPQNILEQCRRKVHSAPASRSGRLL